MSSLLRGLCALAAAASLAVPADAAAVREVAVRFEAGGYHGSAQVPFARLPAGSFALSSPALRLSLTPKLPGLSPETSPSYALASVGTPLALARTQEAFVPGAAVGLSALHASLSASRRSGGGPAFTSGTLSHFFDGSSRPTSAATVPAFGLKPAPRKQGFLPRARKAARRLEKAAVPGLLGLSAVLFADHALTGGTLGRLLTEPLAAALPFLSQASYWMANTLAFVFIFPQIYTMMKNGSAKVSRATFAVGLASTAAMTLDFAYDGQALMTYRNLALAAGFGVGLLLKAWYDRRKEAPDLHAHEFRVWRWKLQVPATVKTVGIATAIAGALFILGPAALAWAPHLVWMRGLMVPLQILSGLGLIYLMFPQLLKIQREGGVGDASKTMVQGYLGTRSIWVWSFATALAIAAGYSAAGLPVMLAFLSAVFPLSWLVLKGASKLRLPRLPEKVRLGRWEFSREKLEALASFALISGAVLAMTLLGYWSLGAMLGVAAAEKARFLMYLFYLVQNVVATLVTLLTLRAFARHAKK